MSSAGRPQWAETSKGQNEQADDGGRDHEAQGEVDDMLPAAEIPAPLTRARFGRKLDDPGTENRAGSTVCETESAHRSIALPATLASASRSDVVFEELAATPR